MKTALVLSGGGAKIGFEAGVIYELMANGYKPDFAVGTSAGSLSSIGLAYLGHEGLLKLILSIESRSEILTTRWWKIPFNGSGIYGLKPLEKVLTKLLSRNPVTNIEAVACYVNYLTSETFYKSTKDSTPAEMVKAVLASSAIPFFMEAVDGCLVDGGVREIAPLQYAIDRLDDGDEIVVVTCQPTGKLAADPYKPSWPLALSIGLRSLDIRDHETLMNDLSVAKVYNMVSGKKRIKIRLFSPEHYLYDTFDFDPLKMAAAVAHGVAVAKSGGIDYTGV